MLGAYGARRARAIVDHNLLAQVFGKFLADRARGEIDAAAGGERHHDAHGLDRIALRARRPGVSECEDCEEKFVHGI